MALNKNSKRHKKRGIFFLKLKKKKKLLYLGKIILQKAKKMVTKIVLLSEKKLKKPIMFVGLPGIGLVGKICVDYFLKQFKTEKIGEIYSDSFPPFCSVK